MNKLFEQALELKEGTRLRFGGDSNPGKRFTKGREYKMQRDAIPIYLINDSLFYGTSKRRSYPNQKPCNCDLPIIDDNGSLVEVCYILFQVVEGDGE